MNRFLLLALTALLISPLAANANSYTSILKKTKDTVKKIEIRNEEQCDQESKIFSQTSGMRREICDYDN
tara:strand:- start:1640 stop:1846 length:207 start_codon:yes stop_codon:yes gene_type:complete